MGVLGKAKALPIRLLLIGLPLTILLGIGMGVLLIDKLSLFEIALLATLLAPTDAALGKAVVTNEAVPEEVRQALNVESGPIAMTAVCTIILSIWSHGVSANPWAQAFSRRHSKIRKMMISAY